LRFAGRARLDEEPKAEKRENSVLFSLMELRSIEDDRVKKEEETARAKAESERLAREDAIRRAKEEEERKVMAEADRVARLEHEKERQIREERLRVEESERRAKVEAAARLEESRIHAEIQARASAKKAPTGMIIGIVGTVILLAGGSLAYVLGVYLPAEQAKQAIAAAEAQERAIKKALADQETKLTSEYDAKINATKDEAEKARLRAEMVQRKAAAEADAARQHAKIKATASPGKAKPAGLSDKCKNSDDPLCGAGL
jgi:colicin import membrane protein